MIRKSTLSMILGWLKKAYAHMRGDVQLFIIEYGDGVLRHYVGTQVEAEEYALAMREIFAYRDCTWRPATVTEVYDSGIRFRGKLGVPNNA